MLLRTRHLVVSTLAVALTACLTANRLPPEDATDAPTAKQFARLSPGLRDQVLPPDDQYEPRTWVDRLVCPAGDLPQAWKRIEKKKSLETYEVQCAGEAPFLVDLDAWKPVPGPPVRHRQLPALSYPTFVEAMKHLGAKEYAQSLAKLEVAIAQSPEEPVYRRERVYLLFVLDRAIEAFVEADALVRSSPDALAWKYRALAARDLGDPGEIVKSLDGVLASCTPRHPLFAEAVCAKGLILSNSGSAEAEQFIRRGCELSYDKCCEEMHSRTRRERQREEAKRREARAARRAVDASRELPVTLKRSIFEAPVETLPAAKRATASGTSEHDGEAAQSTP